MNPTQAKLKKLFILALLFSFSATVEARVCKYGDAVRPGYEGCCQMCPEPFYYAWPVDTITMPEIEYSTCYTDIYYPGHSGVDFLVPDGTGVKAVWSGTAYPYDAGTAGPSPTFYQCGCGVRLETDTTGPLGQKYTIFYCHLLPEGRPPAEGKRVDMGDQIGMAGGGQSNISCRGNSPGPRLYFEIREDIVPDRSRDDNLIDMFSCMPNSCNYVYIDKITRDLNNICDPTDPPGYFGVTECDIMCNENEPDCQWPSYVAGTPCYKASFPERSKEWYAKVNITQTGWIDIERSEVYDFNGDRITTPTRKDNLSDFVKLIAVYNHGGVACGKIQGLTVNWQPYNPSDPNNYCKDIISFFLADEKYTRSVALNPIYRVERYDPLAGYDPNDDSRRRRNKYITVGYEYAAIGVDETDYVNKMQNKDFNPEVDDYYILYVLARKCDIMGNTEITRTCTLNRGGPPDRDTDSTGNLEKYGFSNCEWNLIDAGKYYDLPTIYIKSFEYSRMNSAKGHMLYQTIGEGKYGVDRFFTYYSQNRLAWWNNMSARRLLGHDGCISGDLACSMGASLSEYRSFRDIPGTPPFEPEKDIWVVSGCMRLDRYEFGWGWWSPYAADYFGFEDRDEVRKYVNPKFRDNDGIADTKFDYESGMPDREYVNKSVYSIVTDLWTHFVTKVEWKKFPPHWVHLYDSGGGGIDWHIWLMPCGMGGGGGGGGSYQCIPETMERACADFRCPAGVDNCAYCPANMFQDPSPPITCPPGATSITTTCMVCKTVDAGGGACDGYCCWGGTNVTREAFRSTRLKYYPEDWPYYMKGNYDSGYKISDDWDSIDWYYDSPFPVQPPICCGSSPCDHCAYPLPVPNYVCEYKNSNAEPNDNQDGPGQ